MQAWLKKSDDNMLDKLSDKQFYYWTRRVILAIGAFYIAQGAWVMAAR